MGGNGGAKPRHSELLAKDVPPSEIIPILDRYLMFYIRTADKLQRTARWLEALPGGIKYLREVVLEDKLGINASLEAQMQELVETYFDEWVEAINNPAIAAKFRQFANEGAQPQEWLETESDRNQTRPVYWAKEPAKEDFKGLKDRWSSTAWQPVLDAKHFDGADELPNGISATIRRGDTQLAIWRVRGRWFATQQMCPHKRAFVLSDGLVGEDLPASDADGKPSTPWVSCPHHKRNYDLGSGECKNDEELSIATFPVEAREDGMVYLKLPPVEELDAALGTGKWMVKKGDSGPSPFEELDKKIQFKGLRAKKANVRPMVEERKMMRKPIALMAGGGAGGCGSAPEW